ncbi:hypothetical protein FACS1894202_13950 [Clostridia bacterium]|nr:hypothetical protein FACS1894202_13950 [Clostridia bacterium]
MAGTNISKLLDKGGSFQFTTALKDKKPAPADATATPAVAAAPIWKIAKTIEARPKFGKEKILYKAQSIATLENDSNGIWTLATDGTALSAAALAKLEVALAGSDKKSPAGTEKAWGTFDDGLLGVPVLKSTTKPGAKLNYLVRTAPSDTVPASKAKKFAASTLTKAPVLKPDFKKDLLKGKADVAVGEWDSAEFFAVSDFSAVFTKDTAKTGLALIDGESAKGKVEYGTVLAAKIVATGKKPGSEIQKITLPAIPKLAAAEVIGAITTKGETIKVPKAYEIKDEDKWKSSVKGAKTITVRVKNSAKYNAKTDVSTGDLASTTVEFKFTGLKDAKEKPILSAPTINKDPNGVSFALPSTIANYDLATTGTSANYTLTQVGEDPGLLASVDGTRVQWIVDVTPVDATNTKVTGAFVGTTGVLTVTKNSQAQIGEYTFAPKLTIQESATEPEKTAFAELAKKFYVPAVTVKFVDTTVPVLAAATDTDLDASALTIDFRVTTAGAGDWTTNPAKFIVKIGNTAYPVSVAALSNDRKTLTLSVTGLPASSATKVKVTWEAGAVVTAGGGSIAENSAGLEYTLPQPPQT